MTNAASVGSPGHFEGWPDFMSKPPRGSQPDPMEREVDRLLANLATLGRPAELGSGASGNTPAPRPAIYPRSNGASSSARAPTRADRAALWARVLLGVALGGLMTQWPYPNECGPSLLLYLGAVATVMLTASWIAFASWKLRSAAAHIVSLILFFWGIVLAGEQVLPRIGYAAERASWRCPAGPTTAGESRTAAAPTPSTTAEAQSH
jgi:hypothetical protein